MKTNRPNFRLGQVGDNVSGAHPTIYTLHQSPGASPIARRSFIGIGVSASAAAGLLGGEPTPVNAAEPKGPGGRVIFAHTDAVTGLAFACDGQTLVSTSRDRTVKAWEVAQAELRFRLEGHEGAINDLSISADGERVATASSDRTVTLWDVQHGKRLETLTGAKSSLMSVAFFHGGDHVVAGGSDGSLLTWHVKQNRLLNTTRSGIFGISDLIAADVGERVIAGGTGGKLGLVAHAGPPDALWMSGHEQRVNAVSLAKTSRALAAGDAAGVVTLRTLDNPDVVDTWELHKHAVNAVAFSADERWLASASQDSTIVVSDVATREVLQRLKGPFPFTAIAISPTGRVLAAGDNKGVITLWDLRGGHVIGFLFDEQASTFDAAKFTFRAGQRNIASALPCGSPIPPNATCTCNCVSGKFIRPEVKTVPDPELLARVEERRQKEEERWEEIRGADAARKERRRLAQAQRAALIQQIAFEQYLYYVQRYSQPSSSSSSYRTYCSCNLVYTSR